MNDSIYGYCNECGASLEAVYFVEEEYVNTNDGIMYKTGRKRKAVDYLICPCCLRKECVDDSFDGSWR